MEKRETLWRAAFDVILAYRPISSTTDFAKALLWKPRKNLFLLKCHFWICKETPPFEAGFRSEGFPSHDDEGQDCIGWFFQYIETGHC